MPDQNPELQEDLLEQLLAGAAAKAAKQEAEALAAKGVVTKAEFSTALNMFGEQLIEKITTQVAEQIKKAAPPTPAAETDPEADEAAKAELAKKAGSPGRKGTITGATDPRMDNPVRYIVAKARKEGFENLDDLDKAVVWDLTKKGFTQGMSQQPIEGEDFADEYGA